MPATCQGQGSASPDDCKYEASSTCPLPLTTLEQRNLAAYGGHVPAVTITTSTTWDTVADAAQGLWQLSKDASVNSGPTCSGTYVVTYTRL